MPRRIKMGGAVATGAVRLLPGVRRLLATSMAGYVVTSDVADLDTYIVAPHLGKPAGPLAAVVLGQMAPTR